MPKVAVQLLFGQNEEPFLEAALKSVVWADHFTVCNTAPESEWGKKNKEIVYATIPSDKIRYSELEPDEKGHFSFAEARNKCIESTDIGDLIFIVDSDDVHYPSWEGIVRDAAKEGVDSITAHFYHLMVFKDIYQFVQSREIVYKRYEETQFVKGVHEQLVTERRWPITSGYHYMHYGYVKPQREVFSRWKFYSDLEGDYHHYDGQSPDRILDDRITVSKPVPVDHPEEVQELLESYPECPPLLKKPNRETVPVEKVGLILITYNDEQYIKDCLSTLGLTMAYPKFEVLVLDLGSTDKTLQIVESYDDIIELEVWALEPEEEIMPLAECLNVGLDFFRVRHDIQYIGWIHPDMKFEDRNWLHELWAEMQKYEKIGKVCSANSRDVIPEEIHPGQEQCFIIRKDVVNKVGLFDEGFKGIGGYEDWDYNRRILNHDGYKVMITPRSKVWHKGMGTREKRDTSKDQITNANHYHSKWNTWDPPV